jgi:hypothetical protein
MIDLMHVILQVLLSGGNRVIQGFVDQGGTNSEQEKGRKAMRTSS